MKFLLAIAVVQAGIYGAIAWLSDAFAYGTNEQERPILPMLAMWGASFVLYIAAIRVVVRTPSTRLLTWAIVAPAILFRGMLLPTSPILEVDIYRYLWDGAATARGVNPYRYSPAIVSHADGNQILPTELRKLVDLRDQSPAMGVILSRIHFAELPTVYPPVSQKIFALADHCNPANASVWTRMLLMKSILVLFDLGTCVVLGSLLTVLGMHSGWIIAYAWCPLVLKEFANSGHLDSIAVFWTTVSVWWVLRMMQGGRGSYLAATCGAALFALAIGAKLYPIILLPVMVAGIAARVQWQQALYFCLMSVIFAGLLVAPMLITHPVKVAEPSIATSQDSGQETGLRAFLTQWEMNDFLFMLVSENLRPRNENDSRPPVWFAVVPNSWRSGLVFPLARILGADSKTTSFLAARALMTGVFGVISLALAWRVYQRRTLDYFLEATFLTLAWFWLLSPTQNPWYWTWVLPFLPFTRGRAWIAVSCIAFIYYLRFWFSYHLSDTHIVGTPYTGPQFYDFVIMWCLWIPWLAWLTVFDKQNPFSWKGSAERAVMTL